MKRTRFILILSLAFIACDMALAEEAMTVEMAVNSKYIKLFVHGAPPDSAAPSHTYYSGHTGKCLELVITSLTDKDLLLNLETGRKFISDDKKCQDLMVTHALVFALQGKQVTKQKVYAMCISPSKDSPSQNTVFQIGGMADGYLLQLTSLIERQEYQDSGGQSAVWAVINNSDSNKVSSYKPEQRKVLKRFVAFAKRGLTITDDMIFADDSYGPFLYKKEYFISGEIKWEMLKNGTATLIVLDEQGNFVTNIFIKNKYEAGQQSCNFKVTTCLIEPNKKYLVRLKIKDQTVAELACLGKE